MTCIDKKITTATGLSVATKIGIAMAIIISLPMTYNSSKLIQVGSKLNKIAKTGFWNYLRTEDFSDNI